MAIEKVLVVGMGLMGHGIAQISATAGFETYIYDVSKEATANGLAKITGVLDRKVKKEKISEQDKEAVLARIKPMDKLEAVDVDLVIEAVVENIEVKKQVFAELDAILPEKTIFGSNTSALPCTPMAAATKRSDRFIIIHFHQPPQVMKLVELARGLDTSDETLQAAKDFCQKIGKVAVEIKKDCPGYLTNRAFMPTANEAMWILYEDVCSKEDIDAGFREGFHHPVGPLELSDFVGLDTMLHILEGLHEAYGGRRYLASPLLKNMVAAGRLGVKNGEGFYKYDKRGKKIG